MRNDLPTNGHAIPITRGRYRDMAPRHAWKRIRQIAMQNARLAGISKGEWERRRIEYGSTRGADLAMARLPAYDGARCYLDSPGAGSGHNLDALI